MQAAMKKRFSFPVIWLPIIFFGLVVIIGAIALHQLQCGRQAKQVSLIDAFFTATSATCVTGLTVVDTGISFNLLGQSVILILGTRKMLKYHNASRLQAIFGRASIAKSSPERCYACGFAQSVQPNLTQRRARSRYVNIFRVP